MGEKGDFSRRYILDPVMLPRAVALAPKTMLDVGCGEGRFCRMVQPHGIAATGIDPTPALIHSARARDPQSTYLEAPAEKLPFPDASFELVVSYLTLIDILDIQAAIPEMARVLAPGGSMLIANLNSFTTAGETMGWVKDVWGQRRYFPIDNYLTERSAWQEWRGIRIKNYHRPFGTYMKLLLGAGLQLTYFDEAVPIASAPASRAASYRRVPWFHVMEWRKPA